MKSLLKEHSYLSFFLSNFICLLFQGFLVGKSFQLQLKQYKKCQFIADKFTKTAIWKHLKNNKEQLAFIFVIEPINYHEQAFSQKFYYCLKTEET
jgi:hypothetical protein